MKVGDLVKWTKGGTDKTALGIVIEVDDTFFDDADGNVIVWCEDGSEELMGSLVRRGDTFEVISESR